VLPETISSLKLGELIFFFAAVQVSCTGVLVRGSIYHQCGTGEFMQQQGSKMRPKPVFSRETVLKQKLKGGLSEKINLNP